MKYLPDTNTRIRYRNGRAPTVRRRLAAVHREEVVVCAPVKAEPFHGAARSQDPPRSIERQRIVLDQSVSLPYDDRAAERYGVIRADLAERGTPIRANDPLIAAIAVVRGIALVMHNIGELSRVIGLQVEDCELSP